MCSLSCALQHALFRRECLPVNTDSEYIVRYAYHITYQSRLKKLFTAYYTICIYCAMSQFVYGPIHRINPMEIGDLGEVKLVKSCNMSTGCHLPQCQAPSWVTFNIADLNWLVTLDTAIVFQWSTYRQDECDLHALLLPMLSNVIT